MNIEPLDITIRLLMATLIGAVLGIDRELRAKPAGIRTHALVALGAATVTLSTIEFATGSEVFADAVSRAIQGIVAGVGFLGGGAILKSSSGDDVRGLTTAASIWVVAALGIACGGGFWIAALIALVIAVVVLALGQHLEAQLTRRFRGRGSPDGNGPNGTSDPHSRQPDCMQAPAERGLP